jgi:hypothetical protein
MTTLDPSLPDAVREQLHPGERVRWLGYPHRAVYTFRETWAAFLFGIFWLAVLIPVFIQATGTTKWFLIIVFGGVGVWTLASPIREYWRAHRIIYVVTNQRALVLDGLLYRSVAIFLPGDIGPIDVVRGSFGASNILFSARMRWTGQWITREGNIGFWAITDPEAAVSALAVLKGQP